LPDESATELLFFIALWE